MEEVNYCSRCGAKWEPGSERCPKCGKELKRFRPTANYPKAKVIRLDEAKSREYWEYVVIGGVSDEK
jgi:predicted amidophosphoribosyltransferase